MATFTIQGRLPSANELLRWDRIVGRNGSRKYLGAIKRRALKLEVSTFIWQAVLTKFQGPVDIDVRWFEPNARRDYDNISSAIKIILDALVGTETIKGDSRKWIPNPVQHHFSVDKKNPRIEVTINETETVDSKTADDSHVH